MNAPPQPVQAPACSIHLHMFNITPSLFTIKMRGDILDSLDDEAAAGRAERRAALIQAAKERGLLGSKGRQLGGRFSDALIDEAKRVSGISENTDLLTYALVTVALEDDFGERLIARKGKLPKGLLVAD